MRISWLTLHKMVRIWPEPLDYLDINAQAMIDMGNYYDRDFISTEFHTTNGVIFCVPAGENLFWHRLERESNYASAVKALMLS